ncbi:antitoxin [Leucobacter viscericola]|uniref:Antitoxin n=1 Tax=Leucobacter viscericola TaxID=2714935 RepID=A0A6G7XI39_9MICO|nr:Rv0909 family putative TA system antitoxin [Leucobacter viscericola]QIK64213.1 antitoxin [Leucobacter viscericola]
MGIEDLGKKAGDFVKEQTENVKESLGSEKAEGVSDKVLDGAAEFADRTTGGKFGDQIEDIRATLDEKFGTE